MPWNALKSMVILSNKMIFEKSRRGQTALLFSFTEGGNELLFTPAGVHSNGICPFKVAFGEGQMPRDHHFIGSDAVQRSARHGLNSNHGTKVV